MGDYPFRDIVFRKTCFLALLGDPTLGRSRFHPPLRDQQAFGALHEFARGQIPFNLSNLPFQLSAALHQPGSGEEHTELLAHEIGKPPRNGNFMEVDAIKGAVRVVEGMEKLYEVGGVVMIGFTEQTGDLLHGLRERGAPAYDPADLE